MRTNNKRENRVAKFTVLLPTLIGRARFFVFSFA
eukprot:COSAG02_NODE_13552_length_1379_cov_8.567187_3_plen_33_part_01